MDDYNMLTCDVLFSIVYNYERGKDWSYAENIAR